jgi:hypothetical protein
MLLGCSAAFTSSIYGEERFRACDRGFPRLPVLGFRGGADDVVFVSPQLPEGLVVDHQLRISGFTCANIRFCAAGDTAPAGTPVSAAVRAALIEAARRKAAAAIRAEAEKLAADKADRAEAMQVLRDMETLRAW